MAARPFSVHVIGRSDLVVGHVTKNQIQVKIFRFSQRLTRRAAMGLVVMAGWSVLRWYIARTTDGSDDPCGLLPLCAALWFARRGDWQAIVTPRRLIGINLFLAALMVSLWTWPPLVRALFWVGALAFAGAPDRAPLAWTGLLVLSLPVMASLQFFLGYPARLGVTWAAARLLRAAGFDVVAEATVLRSHAERVLIDAPCSGLQMAWLLGVIALVIAAARGLNARGTAGVLVCAAVAVGWANVLRATLIFVLEIRFHVSAEWMHDLIGLSLFGAAVVAVSSFAEKLPVAERPRLSQATMP